MLILRTAVVLEGALAPAAHALELAEAPASPVDDAPRPSRTEIVAARLAECRRAEPFGLQLLVVRLRVDLEAKPQL